MNQKTNLQEPMTLGRSRLGNCTLSKTMEYTMPFLSLYSSSKYQDQSLFIQEVLDSHVDVLSITRPPQHGKTVTLAMLQSFFEDEGADMKPVFQNLAIGKNSSSMLYQGQYPVIHLDFKSSRKSSIVDCYHAMQTEIVREFQRHKEGLLPTLSKTSQETYTQVLYGDPISGNFSLKQMQKSLVSLSQWLYEKTKNKVFLFIDNYEVPFQTAYQWKFQNSLCQIYGNLLRETLSSNPFLKKAVLMGVIPFALAKFPFDLIKPPLDLVKPPLDLIKPPLDLVSPFLNHRESPSEDVVEMLGEQVEYSSILDNLLFYDFVPKFDYPKTYPRYLRDWLKNYFFPIQGDLYHLIEGKKILCCFESLELDASKLSTHQEFLKLLLFYRILKVVSQRQGVSTFCYEIESASEEATIFLKEML